MSTELKPELHNEPLVKIPSHAETQEYYDGIDPEVVNELDEAIEAEKRLVVSMNALEAFVDLMEADVKVEDKNGILRSVGPQLNAAVKAFDPVTPPLVMADDVLEAHPTGAVDVSMENLKDWLAAGWELFLKGYRALKEKIRSLLVKLKSMFTRSKDSAAVKEKAEAGINDLNDTQVVTPFTVESTLKFKAITFEGKVSAVNREWDRAIKEVGEDYGLLMLKHLEDINDATDKAISEARRVFNGSRQKPDVVNAAMNEFVKTNISSIDEARRATHDGLKWLRSKAPEGSVTELYIGSLGATTTAHRSNNLKNTIYSTHIVPVESEASENYEISDLTIGTVKAFLSGIESNSRKLENILDKAAKALDRNDRLMEELDKLVKSTQKTLMASGVKARQLITISNYASIVGRKVSADFNAVFKAVRTLSLSYNRAKELMLDIAEREKKSVE